MPAWMVVTNGYAVYGGIDHRNARPVQPRLLCVSKLAALRTRPNLGLDAAGIPALHVAHAGHVAPLLLLLPMVGGRTAAGEGGVLRLLGSLLRAEGPHRHRPDGEGWCAGDTVRPWTTPSEQSPAGGRVIIGAGRRHRFFGARSACRAGDAYARGIPPPDGVGRRGGAVHRHRIRCAPHALRLPGVPRRRSHRRPSARPGRADDRADIGSACRVLPEPG